MGRTARNGRRGLRERAENAGARSVVLATEDGGAPLLFTCTVRLLTLSLGEGIRGKKSQFKARPARVFGRSMVGLELRLLHSL